jgi:multicomponent Na+:H+ antiporter subunit G
MTVRDVLAAGLLLAGSGLALSAVIGLFRLPDVYARMHAATKPATLGVALCLTGAAVRADDLSDVVKLLAAIAFQLLTAPVAGHLLGRAAHRTGAPQSAHSAVDELGPSPRQGA